MDESSEPSLDEYFRVRPTRAVAPSSLTWALVPTTAALVGLAVLDVLVLAGHVLGYGAFLVLAPIADGPVAPPDPARHLFLVVLVWVIGLAVAVVASTRWDRRAAASASGPPAAVRGLVVAAGASAVATGVLLVGLGLTPGELLG